MTASAVWTLIMKINEIQNRIWNLCLVGGSPDFKQKPTQSQLSSACLLSSQVQRCLSGFAATHSSLAQILQLICTVSHLVICQTQSETAVPADGTPGYLSGSWLLVCPESGGAGLFKLKRCLVVDIVLPSWFRQSVRLLGSSPGEQRKHSLGGIRLRSESLDVLL